MEVPGDLQEKYLERRQRDLKECFEWLRNENFLEIEKIGHQLKGNASTFGHFELTSIGERLESAAINKEGIIVNHVLKELSQWLKEKLN